MERGFFGAVVLFLAAGLLLGLSSFSVSQSRALDSAALALVSANDAAFTRAWAENSVDSVIRGELLGSALLGLPPEAVNMRVNAAIMSEFSRLGLEGAGMCSDSVYGQVRESELGIASLSSVSKVFRADIGGAVYTRYEITGGIGRNIFPCAKISNMFYEIDFRIPAGYYAEAAVPS